MRSKGDLLLSVFHNAVFGVMVLVSQLPLFITRSKVGILLRIVRTNAHKLPFFNFYDYE